MRLPFPFRQACRLLALPALVLSPGCGDSGDRGYTAAPSPEAETPGGFPLSHDRARLARTGPQACVECHADAVRDWRGSHHAKANRPISEDRDKAAFTPARRVEESGVTYELAFEDGEFLMRVLGEGTVRETHRLVGVIGETPVRQYLTAFPGGRWQTVSATYDVTRDKWIDVFEGEDRRPGEWGHWTGQGMNWNANCAYCHTTEYKKNYDFETDAYTSRWVRQGIAGAECHDGLDRHVRSARNGNPQPTLAPSSPQTVMENCATCHSRRDQLTADAHDPGERYHDHFALSLPDQPGLYYADGQIRDEVFVYGSFVHSRMGHAGVRCMDCHDPHTQDLILPAENNMLCMRCHQSGVMDAPVIEPVAHSGHPAGSTGNRCVECHMPKTTYMQADPRADHGFHLPDPVMTRERGIPNACSRCHTDESLDWAVEAFREHHDPTPALERQRARARAIGDAHAGDRDAIEPLLELLEDEPIPAWRATYAGLLDRLGPHPAADARLRALADDPSPLVRDRVVRAMARRGVLEPVRDGLDDPARQVRVAAARALAQQEETVPGGRARRELDAYLRFNSDRPQPLLLRALRAVGDNGEAVVVAFLKRAVELEPANANLYREAAVLLSSIGRNDLAEDYLYEGWDLAPDNPEFPYSLGLLAAEEGNLDQAAGFLEETVAMAPDFGRAWYNLSLAYSKLGRRAEAAEAMERARELSQNPSSRFPAPDRAP